MIGTLSMCGKSYRNIMGWGVSFQHWSGCGVSGSGNRRKAVIMMAATTNGSPRRNGERFAVTGRQNSWKAARYPSFADATRGLATKKEMGRNWVHGQGVDRAAVEEDMGSEENEEQHCPNPNPKPRLLTLPTILTIGRVAAVPLLITTFYMNGWWATTATTSIFLVAAVTDWLDGYLARRMRLGTPFGAFLDPVADKLMVAATLVLLCTKPFEVAKFGQVPWLLTVPSIAIIGREVSLSQEDKHQESNSIHKISSTVPDRLKLFRFSTMNRPLILHSPHSISESNCAIPEKSSEFPQRNPQTSQFLQLKDQTELFAKFLKIQQPEF